MQGSSPQTYTIAEVLKWNDDKELELNPKFQRGPVWSAPARSYLIDSLLQGYPIPKLLFRTSVDRETRRTLRDVVDGQQRLRTIIDFVSNKFALGSKATPEYRGIRYENLDPDTQDKLLAYKLTCEQLINASDEDVLEIFVRINSYTVPVNEAELRNARFDNEFSTYVKSLIRQVPRAWEIGVLSNRERVRMADQSVIAEILGFFETGIVDGAESDITKVYLRNKETSVEDLPDRQTVVNSIQTAADLLGDELSGEAVVQRPHFLIFVAALLYSRGLLPQGRLDLTNVPGAPFDLAASEDINAALAELNAALDADVSELPASLAQFAGARTSTQRMRSRQVRFEHFCRALMGQTVAE